MSPTTVQSINEAGASGLLAIAGCFLTVLCITLENVSKRIGHTLARVLGRISR